jgi:hypothetical protein
MAAGCPNTRLRRGPHLPNPTARVCEPYGPARPGKRADLQRLSGQNLYPVIEFENGSIYREESKDMAATIRAGKLDEKRGAAT